MIRKQSGFLSGTPYIISLSFLRNIPSTLLAPIFPLFINTLVSKEAYVGYIFTISSFIFLISNFLVARLLQKIDKILLLKISSFVSAVSYFLLTIISNIYQFVLLEIFRLIALSAGFIILMLFIREYSSRRTINRNEGLYFTTANIAWMIGPLIGGIIAQQYNFKTLFIISALFPLIIFFMISLKPVKHKSVEITNDSTWVGIKAFFKAK